ncbi:hypothetical protein DRQ05_06120 [bacterium]|nr:MAG: hypothetical protein DRQ05_06120 [bacterium]
MFRESLVVILILLASLFVSCENIDPVEKEKNRILTENESVLIDYYMKITEFEKNLHDKEAAKNEKLTDLKSEIDTLKAKKIIEEENMDPERWIGVLNRIQKLQTLKER